MKEKIKITMYNNEKVIVNNYNKLLDISLELVRIDNLLIKGNNLKIKKMDNYLIEIWGKVSIIQYEEELSC